MFRCPITGDFLNGPIVQYSDPPEPRGDFLNDPTFRYSVEMEAPKPVFPKPMAQLTPTDDYSTSTISRGTHAAIMIRIINEHTALLEEMTAHLQKIDRFRNEEEKFYVENGKSVTMNLLEMILMLKETDTTSARYLALSKAISRRILKTFYKDVDTSDEIFRF